MADKSAVVRLQDGAEPGDLLGRALTGLTIIGVDRDG